ncbi:MAG: hypothetical protein ABWZ98_18650 [Nakamurella sp.]
MVDSEDVSVGLIRSLVRALNQPSLITEMAGTVDDDWGSLAAVLEFGDGYRGASGYAYAADGTVSPVAWDWDHIEPAVHAYLASYYEPGDLLPVKILVQFERATGRYRVTFEDEDEERWKTRARNYREMREQLRPSFD